MVCCMYDRLHEYVRRGHGRRDAWYTSPDRVGRCTNRTVSKPTQTPTVHVARYVEVLDVALEGVVLGNLKQALCRRNAERGWLM